MSTPNKPRIYLHGFSFCMFFGGEDRVGVDSVNFLYSWSSTDSNLTSPFFILSVKRKEMGNKIKMWKINNVRKDTVVK